MENPTFSPDQVQQRFRGIESVGYDGEREDYCSQLMNENLFPKAHLGLKYAFFCNSLPQKPLNT